MLNYTPMTIQLIKEILEEAKKITDMGYGFIRFSKPVTNQHSEEDDDD